MRTISMEMGILLITNGGRPLSQVILTGGDCPSSELELGISKTGNPIAKSNIIREIVLLRMIVGGRVDRMVYMFSKLLRKRT